MKKTYILLLFLLISNFCVAQKGIPIHQKVPSSSTNEINKVLKSDMTIDELLKTPQAKSLTRLEILELKKMPAHMKVSELGNLQISRGVCCALSLSCCSNTMPPQVVNRIEVLNNGIKVKVYLQEPANNTNRKGLLVIGSGNNEYNPSPGSLTGTLENTTCKKMAEQGYIAAIVEYNVPAVATNYSNWNAVCTAMGQQYNKSINGLISKYGGSRANTIAAGVSFTTFLLLTNIAYFNDLADIKGFMGICGGTGSNQASNFKIPIASISCYNDFEASYNINGENLVNMIGNPSIKAKSYGKRDTSCSGHCTGNTTEWANWLVNIAKTWLP